MDTFKLFSLIAANITTAETTPDEQRVLCDMFSAILESSNRTKPTSGRFFSFHSTPSANPRRNRKITAKDLIPPFDRVYTHTHPLMEIDKFDDNSTTFVDFDNPSSVFIPTSALQSIGHTTSDELPADGANWHTPPLAMRRFLSAHPEIRFQPGHWDESSANSWNHVRCSSARIYGVPQKLFRAEPRRPDMPVRTLLVATERNVDKYTTAVTTLIFIPPDRHIFWEMRILAARMLTIIAPQQTQKKRSTHLPRRKQELVDTARAFSRLVDLTKIDEVVASAISHTDVVSLLAGHTIQVVQNLNALAPAAQQWYQHGSDVVATLARILSETEVTMWKKNDIGTASAIFLSHISTLLSLGLDLGKVSDAAALVHQDLEVYLRLVKKLSRTALGDEKFKTAERGMSSLACALLPETQVTHAVHTAQLMYLRTRAVALRDTIGESYPGEVPKSLTSIARTATSLLGISASLKAARRANRARLLHIGTDPMPEDVKKATKYHQMANQIQYNSLVSSMEKSTYTKLQKVHPKRYTDTPADFSYHPSAPGDMWSTGPGQENLYPTLIKALTSHLRVDYHPVLTEVIKHATLLDEPIVVDEVRTVITHHYGPHPHDDTLVQTQSLTVN